MQKIKGENNKEALPNQKGQGGEKQEWMILKV
jgi:hypothetical protein